MFKCQPYPVYIGGASKDYHGLFVLVFGLTRLVRRLLINHKIK